MKKISVYNILHSYLKWFILLWNNIHIFDFYVWNKHVFFLLLEIMCICMCMCTFSEKASVSFWVHFMAHAYSCPIFLTRVLLRRFILFFIYIIMLSRYLQHDTFWFGAFKKEGIQFKCNVVKRPKTSSWMLHAIILMIYKKNVRSYWKHGSIEIETIDITKETNPRVLLSFLLFYLNMLFLCYKRKICFFLFISFCRSSLLDLIIYLYNLYLDFFFPFFLFYYLWSWVKNVCTEEACIWITATLLLTSV